MGVIPCGFESHSRHHDSYRQNRFLIKEASPEKITGKWKEIVDEIIKTCKEHLDDRFVSMYIGGSVAHGKAVENKSDVDSYVLVNLNRDQIEENQRVWVDIERKRLDNLFPFQRGVEIHLIPINNISEGKKFQMKVLSVWVYGKNYSNELPEYKLDKETLKHIRVNMEKDIQIARKELQETEDVKEIRRIGPWIAKRLIRSAGMMWMWKGDFFTMDINVLADNFVSSYPDKKLEIGGFI